MAQNNGVVKGLVIGLLAGGAIGAVLALLYAPKSGKELRADIKDRADGLLEDADSYMQAAKSKASDIVSDAKQRSERLVDDARKKATTLIDDADRVISGAKQKAGVVVEDGVKIKNAVKAGMDAFREERDRS
ncbi:MAG: YtxH domain-containing protein [Bacteroidota bacterium]